MRTLALTALLGTAALLSGCRPVVSIHPLYTEETRDYDPALLGAWTDKDGDDVYLVRPADDNAYTVTVIPKGPAETAQRFTARLVSQGGYLFLDLLPLNTPDFSIPGHSFLRLRRVDDSWFIAPLKEEWIEKHRDQLPAHIAGSKESKFEILFTAPTAELRSFLGKYAGDPEAFEEAELIRLH